jgi:hypothetical protein
MVVGGVGGGVPGVSLTEAATISPRGYGISEVRYCISGASISCMCEVADTSVLLAIAPVSDVPYPSTTATPNTSQIHDLSSEEEDAPPTNTILHRFPSSRFSFHCATSVARTSTVGESVRKSEGAVAGAKTGAGMLESAACSSALNCCNCAIQKTGVEPKCVGRSRACGE